jgi:hypothetical protein
MIILKIILFMELHKKKKKFTRVSFKITQLRILLCIVIIIKFPKPNDSNKSKKRTISFFLSLSRLFSFSFCPSSTSLETLLWFFNGVLNEADPDP